MTTADTMIVGMPGASDQVQRPQGADEREGCRSQGNEGQPDVQEVQQGHQDGHEPDDRRYTYESLQDDAAETFGEDGRIEQPASPGNAGD